MLNLTDMRNAILFVVCLAILTSCQKEAELVDPANPGGGANNPNGTQLVRIGSRVGADTLTTNITYTAAGRIHTFAQSGTVNGFAITASIRAVRNSFGVITSTVIKTNVLAQLGLDSVVVFHQYDAAASRYKYSVSTFVTAGVLQKDSTVFTYNGSGQLTMGVSYSDDGSGYEPDFKTEFTYNGANIATKKEYSSDGTGGWDLDETVTHEYDTKTAPLSFPADAVVLDPEIFYSANNPVKSTTAAAGTSVVRSISYVYNAANRPVTATTSGTGGAAGSTNTYTYQ